LKKEQSKKKKLAEAISASFFFLDMDIKFSQGVVLLTEFKKSS
jgi:hypothetical protein